jgi:hypothetical protein
MAKRPNIIFIMPDQLRADLLSCYGATFIESWVIYDGRWKLCKYSAGEILLFDLF